MTKEERQKIYEALAAPFSEAAIERSDGRVTGRGYDTTGIKYQYVVNRLNEILGVGGYRVERSVKIRETTTAKGRPAFEATCEVKVTLGEWIDGQFAPFAEAIGDGGHTSTSEADAIKGSFTNGFKKCVAFFGVGKQAYEGTLDDDNLPAAEVAHPAQPPSAQRSKAAAPIPPSPQGPPPRNRLTAKQLSAIWAIARRRGFEETAFRESVKKRFGAQPEYLTAVQASDLIGALSGNGDDRHPRQEE